MATFLELPVLYSQVDSVRATMIDTSSIIAAGPAIAALDTRSYVILVGGFQFEICQSYAELLKLLKLKKPTKGKKNA